jgi:hypothetical protein
MAGEELLDDAIDQGSTAKNAKGAKKTLGTFASLASFAVDFSYSYRSAWMICRRAAWRAGNTAASAPKIKPAAVAAMSATSGNV